MNIQYMFVLIYIGCSYWFIEVNNLKFLTSIHKYNLSASLTKLTSLLKKKKKKKNRSQSEVGFLENVTSFP